MENKAAQRRIIDEVINQKNLDLADRLFSDMHALHPQALGVGRGPEGMKRAFAGLHDEFPDVRVVIESMVAEGDMVAVRLTFRRYSRADRRTGRMAGNGLHALLRGQSRRELASHGFRPELE